MGFQFPMTWFFQKKQTSGNHVFLAMTCQKILQIFPANSGWGD
jgi:hypothetical protein